MPSIEEKNDKFNAVNGVSSVEAMPHDSDMFDQNNAPVKESHKQVVNALISTISNKQFNRLIQDFDTASLIYGDNAMSGRGTQKPRESIQKTSINVQLVAFEIDILCKLVKSRYEQVLRDNHSKEEREIGAEYWDNIKTNFELLIKSIQEKRQSDSAALNRFPSAE
jgi:hypothetical protein